MKKPPKKRGVAQVPIHGKASHNAAFLVSIGNLVVNWANNESVFLAMLQMFFGHGGYTAAIVWHSHRTTVARLDLISRLCRERLKDETLIKDVDSAIQKFKAFSRMRNFYCHATYRYSEELHLVSAQSVTASQEGDPIRFEVKRLDLAALNEMGDTTIRLGEFNAELWKLVRRLQDALGAHHVVLPQAQLEPRTDQESHPHSDAGRSPEAPQSPSQE